MKRRTVELCSRNAAVDFYRISTIYFYSSFFIVQLYLSPFAYIIIDFTVVCTIIKGMKDHVLHSFDMFLVSSSRFRPRVKDRIICGEEE